MNVGIIGAGAIATYLLQEFQKNSAYNIHVTSLFVRDSKKYEQIGKKFDVTLYTNLNDFLNSPVDIVVEAANISAVTSLLPKIIKKKDIVMISIGALAEEYFFQQIKSAAVKYKRNIYLPSGAIGGLDLVQNVSSVGKIETITLETRKPAHTLLDEKVSKAQVIFSGNAAEAINKYPKNMNVSIALSLAGVGFNETQVTLIADPMIDNNHHSIHVHGEFGAATFSITNKALQANPNTSYLAAISVIGTLTRLTSSVKIGY